MRLRKRAAGLLGGAAILFAIGTNVQAGWLYVLSGSGVATLGGRKHRIRGGSLVLIERGTTHEIQNTGRTPLKTLNVYVPPAYTSAGDELPRGRG